MTVQELKQEAKWCGAKLYYISTAFDERTCKDCFHHEGRVYHISEAKVGKTLPPFHEFCRCAVCFDTREADYNLQRKKNEEFFRDALKYLNNGDDLLFAMICYEELVVRPIFLSEIIKRSMPKKYEAIVLREYQRAISYANELKTLNGRRKRMNTWFFSKYESSDIEIPENCIFIIKECKNRMERDIAL
ncbi:MAG: phage head morphogenesis protein [Oscillospiraceae bacterium]|nr:phage head morphogenesis protein [Oscillospiraceae bacterium]